MKNWLLIIIFGIAFVSCENDVERQKINMTSNVKSQTKALVMDNPELGTLGFGVMCYSKENGTFDSLTDIPNYYYNLRVYKQSTAWVTSAVLYWPESANVSFVAYAPYSTSENGITLSPSTQVGYPTISYFANNIDITKQVDLCYSTPQLNKTQIDGTVAFTFNHSLSKISFSAKNYYAFDTIAGCKIKSIRLTNIIKKGSILLNSNPSWIASSLASDTVSYYLNIANSMLKDQKLNMDFQQINQDNACLMLIPQNIDITKSKLEIVVSDLLGNEIKTNYLTLSSIGLTQIKKGQNINIKLVIIAGKVYASIVVLPWIVNTFGESTIGK
jgi:hypothetical protein